MREKRRNISWLSIFSSAFLPNEMLDKCNFQHMFDVNIMSLYLALTTKQKKFTGGKKSSKSALVSCMSLQFSSFSHFLSRFQWNKCWLFQKIKDALWLVLNVQQTGDNCSLCHRHLQCKSHRNVCPVASHSQHRQEGQRLACDFPSDLCRLT